MSEEKWVNVSDPADLVSVGLAAVMTAADHSPTALALAADAVMRSGHEDAIVALHASVVGIIVGMALAADDDATPSAIVRLLAELVGDLDAEWEAIRAAYDIERLEATFAMPAYDGA